ncbi:MAG: glycosyltransferase family 1 protein [Bacteroidota bacterium]|nr:glycosyltransferase family 1 protein [Bacteroidota bacterium]
MTTKLIVIFDATKTGNRESGLGNFCYNLGKEISLIKPERFEIQFLVHKEQINLFGPEHKYIMLNATHKFPVNNFKNTSLLHACWQLSSLQSSNKKLKWLYTVHDLNFLFKYKSFKKTYYTSRFLSNIKRADKVVCISQATNVLFADLTGDNYRADIIYNGNSLSNILHTQKPAIDLPQRYLFFIGIISPKKNIESIFELLQQIPELNLVLAGEAQTIYKQQLQQKATQLNIVNSIIFTGKVSEEEKLYLYKNCEAYINPSIAEGFGIPVVEAMSMGKPLVLNNIPAFMEIAGDLALYITPENKTDFRNSYDHYLQKFNDSEIEDEIKCASQKFSWKQAAESYVKLYEDILFGD